MVYILRTNLQACVLRVKSRFSTHTHARLDQHVNHQVFTPSSILSWLHISSSNPQAPNLHTICYNTYCC